MTSPPEPDCDSNMAEVPEQDVDGFLQKTAKCSGDNNNKEASSGNKSHKAYTSFTIDRILDKCNSETSEKCKGDSVEEERCNSDSISTEASG